MSISKQALNVLFSQTFNLDSYKVFVWELFNQAPKTWDFVKPKDDDSYEFLRLMTYEDSAKKKLDVVIIKMKDNSSIEKARVKQRNIISKNFVGYKSGKWIQNALIVFYNENQAAWRFSYIKQEFILDENEKPIDKLTPAKRFSFFVNPDLKNVTVKKNFRSLLDDAVSPTVAEIETAFSVEAVTKEFFKNYVERYQYILELFKSDSVFQKIEETVNHGDEQFAENFVKKLLGQIVFIYFLQRKWWMWVEEKELRWNGKQTYLKNLYEECIAWWDPSKENWGINYFNDYLEWLFYDTLNKQRDDHRSEYFTTKIPYLNGWLFEPVNGYNWKWPDNVIFKGNEKKANDAFWELLKVFDMFNFTVFENDPLEQDVAVDPEMLGKIFENLLPENERKGKWSFYTPRPIVHYMCKESLKQYLKTKTWLSEDRINKLIVKKDSMDSLEIYEKERWEKWFQEYLEFKDIAQQIDNALEEVKIVDPAVWSWAFPMGILKEIVSTREYIQRSILQNPSKNLRYDLKKEALQNSIYGVDIDPGAVEIAKLRFRLSLVVENDSQEIEPLPNLDYKFMQWNSLIDQLVLWDSPPIEIFTDEDLMDSSKADKALYQWTLEWLEDDWIRNVLDELKYYHTKYFNTNDGWNKKELKNKIDYIERKLIRTGCQKTINDLIMERENLTTKYTLSWVTVTDKDAHRINQINQTIQDIKQMEDKFNRDQIRPFFPWKLHFGEVFKENWWFDIVIGNPPYVWEKGNKEMFRLLKRSDFWSKYYVSKMDLFYYFFHLWFYINNPKWTTSYITTNYFYTADWATKLRKAMQEKWVIELINFNEFRIFETALWQHNTITFLWDSESQTRITNVTSNWWPDENKLLKILDKKLNDIEMYNWSLFNELWNIQLTMRTWLGSSILNKMVKLEKLTDYANVLSWCDITLSKIWKKHIWFDIDSNIWSWVFVLNEKEKEKLYLHCNEYEKSLFKKFIKNSDISKYWCEDSSKTLLYIDRNENINRIPNLVKHLSKYKTIIDDQISRYDEPNWPWYSIHRPRELKNFENIEKIIVPYRAKSNIFWCSLAPVFSSRDVFYIITNWRVSYKYLLWLLNSSIIHYWLINKWKMKWKTLELYATPLNWIPIKLGDLEAINQVEKLVSDMMTEWYSLNKQNKINTLFYKIYWLSTEEYEIVEGIIN